MTPLMLHHSCHLGPIKAVLAKIDSTETGFDAEFRLDGRISGIRLPANQPNVRADGLWKTTCFEVFWQEIGASGYCEFNFSPAGQWAAYSFDNYREGMRNASVDAIALASSHSEANGIGEFVLRASVAADLPDPAQIGLSAVIEHQDGNLQYWALAFGPSKPDFHSEACRQMILQR